MALHSHDGTWLSLCLDLALSAQASSLEEAQRRLSQEIRAQVLLCQTDDTPLSGAIVVRRLSIRHRLACQLIYWLAPLRKGRVYRETLPFGLAF